MIDFGGMMHEFSENALDSLNDGVDSANYLKNKVPEMMSTYMLQNAT